MATTSITTTLSCGNIFSGYFSLYDLDQETKKIELVTTFEFFEHVSDPGLYCEKIFDFSDTILFTTEIAPDHISSVEDWWYFVPETGQHITFYTLKSLEYLAHRRDANFYTDGSQIHIITRKKISGFDISKGKADRSKQSIRDFFLKTFWLKAKEVRKKNVSIQEDYLYIKGIINEAAKNKKN
jgi:hypothetical protein